MDHHSAAGQGRRDFFKRIAGTGGTILGVGNLRGMLAQSSPDWRKQIGLELYTVRELLAKDFEGTFAKVAEIGYREVEPVGYGGLDPKAFRALLDRYKLSAPSTHTTADEGPDLEKQLAGHQLMGFRYTQLRAAAPPRAAGAPPAPRPARTVESVKRTAATYNRQGALVKKFGMKILIHNHAIEFDRLDGSDLTEYDVLLAETDPATVAMQLDIGWAIIAGQDVLRMFAKHPGRFDLWHVKDVKGLKIIDTSLPPGQRRATFMPIGQGEIDYKPIFAKAAQAGLKYFVIEQDNAGQNGADSLAAARAGYQGLVKTLS
jgi:sugar phosphate isomerase/epimerase